MLPLLIKEREDREWGMGYLNNPFRGVSQYD